MFFYFHLVWLLVPYWNSVSFSALRPLSMTMSPLFKYNPNWFLYSFLFTFYVRNLKPHTVIWYRFLFKMSSHVVIWASIQSKSISYLHSFPDFNGCTQKVNRKKSDKHNDIFNWNESLRPCSWFMIKILKNLSFICIRNMVTFVY